VGSLNWLLPGNIGLKVVPADGASQANDRRSVEIVIDDSILPRHLPRSSYFVISLLIAVATTAMRGDAQDREKPMAGQSNGVRGDRSRCLFVLDRHMECEATPGLAAKNSVSAGGIERYVNGICTRRMRCGRMEYFKGVSAGRSQPKNSIIF